MINLPHQLLRPPGRRKMAVTHEDLVVRERSGGDAASVKGLSLIVFCVLCGLLSFILSLSAEATRSEVISHEIRGICKSQKKMIILMSSKLSSQATRLSLSAGRQEQESRCFYNSSGKTPLAFGLAAFMALAVGMFTAQVYILLRGPPTIHRALTRQACFFFIAAWTSFAIAEVALMVGVSAESDHLGDWRRQRTTCLVVRQGLFAAAGVFALITVFLAAGLYLTALQAQRVGTSRHDEEENNRRRIPAPSAPRLHPDLQAHRHSGEILSGSKASPSS